MHLLDRIQAAANRVTARLTLVGADPHDDEDLRARKALLVLISVLILPVAALWGALYLAFGSPVGVVPLVYFGVLLGAIVFGEVRSAVRWYVAYVVVFLGSGAAGEAVGPVWEPLPGWFTSTM